MPMFGSPVWSGVNQRLHWSFEHLAKFEETDEQKLGKFPQMRNLIDAKVKAWLAE